VSSAKEGGVGGSVGGGVRAMTDGDLGFGGVLMVDP
jgi:hypothetical protein